MADRGAAADDADPPASTGSICARRRATAWQVERVAARADGTALDGITQPTPIGSSRSELIRKNVRSAIQGPAGEPARREQRYGDPV